MYGKIYQVGLHLILNNGMHCPASSYHAVEQNEPMILSIYHKQLKVVIKQIYRISFGSAISFLIWVGISLPAQVAVRFKQVDGWNTLDCCMGGTTVLPYRQHSPN